MRATVFFMIIIIAIATSGCASMMPDYYVHNKPLTSNNKKLAVEIEYLFQRSVVMDGNVSYYPKDDNTLYSVFLNITNKSNEKVKTDLRRAFLVEGKTILGASKYLEAGGVYIKGDVNPVKYLAPGEHIRRNIVYVVPLHHVPDYFVWKNIGKIRIPQTLPQK